MCCTCMLCGEIVVVTDARASAFPSTEAEDRDILAGHAP